ncbi:MAG TPA: hypothetical protein VL728_19665 [Cyclobacteriaceae bacterium]|jgi:hypothetical protein|nr:hypothetical protein [Cyclobacteriaceae bacterium]
MAKDYPYFKFYVSEYNEGDIQLCSWGAQGLFTNLCSFYWSKQGDLFLSKAKRHFKAPEKIWKELIEERVIKIVGEKIVISFLDEQLAEREIISKQNSDNVSKRYQKRTIEATPVEIRSTDNSRLVYNKEEKRREEKIVRGEESESTRAILIERNFEWFKKQINEIWVDQLPSEKKLKLAAAIENAWSFLTTDSHRLKIIDSNGCTKLVNNAFEFLKNGTNGKHRQIHDLK